MSHPKQCQQMLHCKYIATNVLYILSSVSKCSYLQAHFWLDKPVCLYSGRTTSPWDRNKKYHSHGFFLKFSNSAQTSKTNLHHLWKKTNQYFLFFTGMEEASCEKASYVSTYLDNTGDFAVIQGPAARIRPSRLPENYFSCEFPSTKHPTSLLPSSALSFSLFVDLVLSCVSLLSRLWGPDEEPVGMRSIPNVTFVLIRRMKNYLLAWFQVKQSHSPSAVCWFSSSVSVLKCRTADQPMRPYLKENLPKRMHFANNKRIERGHLYMKRGWQAAL